jgi:hypothetical protein
MSKSRKTSIAVQGTAITILTKENGDYISLTDMVRNSEGGGALIEQWLKNKDTVLFLGVLEQIHNPDFNSFEFEGIKNEAGRNSFFLSAKKWIELTGAHGLVASAGRYGGTYAHQDIAFEFGSWLCPEFKLYLIKESRRLSLTWNLNRTLSKLNYRIHTNAIRDHLIPPEITPAQAAITYANEADMRHLIDTYIEAGAPRKISPFDDMTLLELIIKSGIAAAINSLPGGIRGNKGAIAETIANIVRSKIIKEHLNNPAFYNKMSALLDEIIADLRARRIDYAAYLKRIAELARKVQTGLAEDTPEPLRKSPALRALFDNLKKPTGREKRESLAEEAAGFLKLAQTIDETVKKTRPDDWRGVKPREQVIKSALYDILQDEAEVERIFLIVKQQPEY